MQEKLEGFLRDAGLDEVGSGGHGEKRLILAVF